MRAGFVVAGVMLCLIGIGGVYYQVSERREDNTLANAYKGSRGIPTSSTTST